MRFLNVAFAGLSLFALVPAAQAAATPLNAQEALREFNVIVFGDVTSTSHVDGRGYVGGNLNGGDFMQHASRAAASAYSGLTVMGQAQGRISVNGGGVTTGGSLWNANINSGTSYVAGNANNVNFNGASAVLGSTSGVNFNGPRLGNPQQAVSSALDIARSTDFSSLFLTTAQSLSRLGDTSGSVDIVGNKVTFSAAPVNGVAVFDLTRIDDSVFKSGEFAFNLNGAHSVIFNSDNADIRVSANFLGGSAQSIADKVIWNFYNATSVVIDRTFGGTVLAPLGSFSNLGGANLEGSLVAKSLIQNGEIHLQAYTGVIPAVPEPSSYAMLLAGLAGIGLIRRRRGRS